MKKNNKQIVTVIGLILLVLLAAHFSGLFSLVPADINGYPRGTDSFTGAIYTPLARNLNEIEQTNYQPLINQLYEFDRYKYSGYCVVDPIPKTITVNQLTTTNFTIYPPSGENKSYSYSEVAGRYPVVWRATPFMKIGVERINLSSGGFATGDTCGLNANNELVRIVDNFYGRTPSGVAGIRGDSKLSTSFIIPSNFVGVQKLELWMDYCYQQSPYQAADNCDSHNLVKILDWDAQIISDEIITDPVQPEFNLFDSIVNWLKDLLKNFGLVFSIVGQPQVYTNQPYDANIDLVSPIAPDNVFSDGKVVKLFAGTAVVDADGKYLFTSPQAELTSSSYNYELNYVPTVTGDQYVVAVISKLENTYNYSTGKWLHETKDWGTPEIVIKEAMKISVASIDKPIDPNFNIFSFFGSIWQWILDLFG